MSFDVIYFFKVMEVAWNIDSTVLAVWEEELPSEESSQDFIPNSYGKTLWSKKWIGVRECSDMSVQ